MNQSTKDSFKLTDFTLNKSNAEPESISKKLNEAKSILSTAKDHLSRMTKSEESYEFLSSSQNLIISQRKNLDACLLASEMRTSISSLEQQVKHLTLLSDQLLNAGYYRRNPYPHPWRLTKARFN